MGAARPEGPELGLGHARVSLLHLLVTQDPDERATRDGPSRGRYHPPPESGLRGEGGFRDGFQV